MTPLNIIAVSSSGDEPVTLAEAKAQCRVSHSMHDALISAYITAARIWVENRTKTSLVNHVYRASYERPSGCAPFRFELCRPPVSEVLSVSYKTDSESVAIDPSEYVFDPDSTRGEVSILSSGVLFATKNIQAPVSITFETGPEEVDELFKLAIKMMVSNFYENETPVTSTNLIEAPLSVTSILSQKRILNSY